MIYFICLYLLSNFFITFYVVFMGFGFNSYGFDIV